LCRSISDCLQRRLPSGSAIIVAREIAMVVRFAVTILLFGLLSTIPTLAQDTNAVQRGRTVVERRCAACHAVRPGETTSPNTAATSFTRVATTPGVTELALQARLQTSHQRMPNLILDADDMRDVIAYILGLATR
jgi:mono/diheme cytochrome c family protein